MKELLTEEIHKRSIELKNDTNWFTKSMLCNRLRDLTLLLDEYNKAKQELPPENCRKCKFAFKIEITKERDMYICNLLLYMILREYNYDSNRPFFCPFND